MPENLSPYSLTQDIASIEREHRKNITIVTARPRITRAFFVAWGALIVLMLGFFIVTVGWYGVQGLFEDRALKNALLRNEAFTYAHVRAEAPEALTVVQVESIATGSDGMFDAYAKITNPNARHAAEFLYTFSHAGGSTKTEKGFLNPGETAFFLLPRATEGKPRALTVAVSDSTWIYLSPHDVAHTEAWYKEHAAFTVADVVFAQDISYADAMVSRTTFSVKNRTPYSYWEPSFLVQIFRGRTLLGMTEISATQFISGEERTLDARWFGDLPQTATVTVTPRIPFFDPEAYMPPQASTLNDVRTRWGEEN